MDRNRTNGTTRLGLARQLTRGSDGEFIELNLQMRFDMPPE